MEEKHKNEMFNFFNKRHDVLLTQDEIEEINDKFTGFNDIKLVRLIKLRINKYRSINAVLLLITVIPLHFFATTWIPWVVYLFVLYNVLHLIVDWYVRFKKK